MTETHLELIMTRRESVWYFQDRELDEEFLAGLLQQSCNAPALLGEKTWKVIICKNKKKQLVDHLADWQAELPFSKYTSRFLIRIYEQSLISIRQAPVLLIFISRRPVADRFALSRDDQLENSVYRMLQSCEIQSISAFIENFHLLAGSKDLGFLWIGILLIFKNRIRELLHLENDPIAFAAVGYPATGRERPRQRKKQKDFIEYI